MAAALIHFTSSFSLSSHKPFPRVHHLHNGRRTKLLFTVSADRFAFSAATFRKPRGGKKRMSNVELCDAIKEFLYSAGLPESHVPSVKGLSLHGRNDLANIVRRRGYKLIGELLANATSLELQTEGFFRREISMERQLSNCGTEETIEDNLSGIPNDTSDGVQGFIDAEFNGCVSKVDIQQETPIEIQSEDVRGSENSSLALNDRAANQITSSHTKLGHILVDVDLDNNLDAEMNKGENLAEISHLKNMMPQKELELSRLKALTEKEQLALSVLQDKAEKEISKAQKHISDQDAELEAAEESLSELTEVEIQYSGEGEMLELAGSFNGWQCRIQMDPTDSTYTTASRKSRVWSTMLWLYPGTYEIKFVVDDEWKIDPEKETITRGSITNNVLRADR